jgi:hypothetical protein
MHAAHRSRLTHKIVGFSVALVLCGATMSPPAHASQAPAASGHFRVDDRDPELNIPTLVERERQPLEFGYFVQELLDRAGAATKRGDHAAASRYYRAFALAAPEDSAAFSKLCAALEAAGERAQAIEACRDALGRRGAVLEDHLRFVRLVIGKTGDLDATVVADANAIVKHLQEQPETRVAGYHVQCELALRIESIPMLEACTTALAAAAPDDPKTVSFQWALAMRKDDRVNAERLIGKAKLTGVAPEGVERMRQAASLRAWSDRSTRLPSRRISKAIVGFVGVVVAIAAIATLALWRRRRALKHSAA